MNEEKTTNKQLLENLKKQIVEFDKEEFLQLLRIIGEYKQELFEICGIDLENGETIILKEFFEALGLEFINLGFVETSEEDKETIIIEFKTTIEDFPKQEE